MVASHTPPMRPGRGREAPPGRQGGSGVPGGVSGPRRSTGGTRARSGGGLDRRPAPLNRGRAPPVEVFDLGTTELCFEETPGFASSL